MFDLNGRGWLVFVCPYHALRPLPYHYNYGSLISYCNVEYKEKPHSWEEGYMIYDERDLRTGGLRARFWDVRFLTIFEIKKLFRSLKSILCLCLKLRSFLFCFKIFGARL